MQIDDESIEFAVLALFFDLHTPPEGRIDLQALASEWPRYRLRAYDLPDGIERLVRKGHLRTEQEGASRFVALTGQGFDYARSKGSSAEMLKGLWARLRARLGA
jgi:hypothetical protein